MNSKSKSKGLTINDIKKYVGIFFKKGVCFEEFDVNNGIIEVGDICKKEVVISLFHFQKISHFYIALSDETMYWFALLPPLWKTRDAHIDWMTIEIPSRNLLSGLTVVRMGEVKITLCGKGDGGSRASYKSVDLESVRENMAPQLLKRQLLQGIFYVKSLEVDFPTAAGGLVKLHIEEISVETTDEAFNPITVLPKEGGTEREKEEKRKKRRWKRKKLFSRKKTREDTKETDEEEDDRPRKTLLHKKVWMERFSMTVTRREEEGEEVEEIRKCGHVLKMEGMTTRMSIENCWAEGKGRMVVRAETIVDKAKMKVEGWTLPHLTDFGSVLLQALVAMYFPPNTDIIRALKGLLGTEDSEVTLYSDLHVREVSFECMGADSHEKVFKGSTHEGRTYSIEIGSFVPNKGAADTLTVHKTNFTVKDFTFHQEIRL